MENKEDFDPMNTDFTEEDLETFYDSFYKYLNVKKEDMKELLAQIPGPD